MSGIDDPAWLDAVRTAAEGVRDAVRARNRAQVDKRDAEQREIQAAQVFEQRLAELRALLDDETGMATP